MKKKTGSDANLRSEAVEAMNVLIKNSARDMVEVVRSTLQVVLSQLEQSFSAPVLTAEDRDRLQGLQSLLCGNLQVCTYFLYLCTYGMRYFIACVDERVYAVLERLTANG